ncbi:DUF6767 domain-containing protein [Mobilicoccus massiliensis]|uniref:DUF6767 domain-containing protein n=1 Tax=Mobilicoccus massiliensis TaxID=1522310 RepID=UPI00058B2AA9|nr:DUF6767 domain-containing protein [Mobilicoccus massiliensis]
MVPRPDAACPIRTGEPCTLCHHGASGPHDCPLVYLVMNDPELKEALAEQRRTMVAARRTTRRPERPCAREDSGRPLTSDDR